MAKQPTMTRQEKSDRVKELSLRLTEFAESVDPVEQARYAARFDHYSPRNVLAIMMQAPNATVVHGYRQWLAEGRQVRKGEHGIQILAPAGSRVVEADDGDIEKVLRWYRVAFVFDISQTDPLS